MLKPTSLIVRGLNILRRTASGVFFAVCGHVVATPVFSYTRAYARDMRAYRWTPGKKRLVVAVASCVVLLVGLAVNFSAYQPARAAVSDNLNFQARLEKANGAIANDGNYNIRFRLYNASTGGTALWTESYLNSASQGVRVVNGYVSVNLGSVTAFPGNISWDQNMYITMEVGGTSTGTPTWDGEMNPRLKLTAVPYAFQAKSATQLQATDSGNVATLSFTTPTQNNSILLPNASGTVCLQSSSSCGFAASTGATGYIWNGTTQQTANFNIVSANAASVTALIQGASGQTANIFEVRDASGNLSLGVNQFGNVFAGPSSSVGGRLAVSTGSTTARGVIIQGVSGQTGSLLQLQDNAANVNAAFSGSGAQLSLGRASGITGQLVLNNASGAGGITLQGTATAGSYVLNLPAENGTLCSTGSICAGYAAAPTSGSFVELAPSAPQTDSSTNASLAINKTGASGNLLTLQNNGVNVATIGNTGNTVFRNSTNSTAAFQIQNSAGTSNLLVADTTNSKIGIGTAPNSSSSWTLQVNSGGIYSAGQIVAESGIYSNTAFILNGTETDNGYLMKRTIAGGTVSANDVVVMNASAQTVTTSTARDTRVYGVAGSAATAGNQTPVAIAGNTTVNADASYGAIAIGDQLVTSPTAGRVMKDNNATTGILGYATSALASGTGTVGVRLQVVTGQSSPIFRNATNSSTAFQIQNAAGTSFVVADSSNGSLAVGSGASTTNGILSVLGSSTRSGLYVQGGASGTSTAAILRAGNTSSNALDVQASNGDSIFLASGTLAVLNNNNTAGFITNTKGTLLADSGRADQVALQVRGRPSQTADLLQLQNSSANVLAGFDASGRLQFANGSGGAYDTSLYRSAADTLRTDDNFSVGGTALFQNATNSTTAFQIQNTAGNSNLFVADTVNNRIGIGIVPNGSSNSVLQVNGNILSSSQVIAGTSLNLSSAGATAGYIQKGAVTGSTGVSANDVVILVEEGGVPKVVTTTIPRDPRVYGVSECTFAANTGGCGMAIAGNHTINVDSVAVNFGDQLVTSSTAGRATVDNNATTGIIGYATSTKAAGSNGTVGVRIQITGGQYSPTFRNATDSTSAFKVQTADETNVLSVNTTHRQVNVGNAISGSYAANLNVKTSGSTAVGQIIQASTSQTADLMQLQNASANVLAGFDASGRLQFANGSGGAYDTSLYRASAGYLQTNGGLLLGNQLVANNSTTNQVNLGWVNGANGAGISFGNTSDTNLYRYASGSLQTDGGLRVGTTLRVQNGVGFGGDNQSGNQLTVFSTVAANRGIVIRGAASQTGDLFQLQNSSANLLTAFDSSGRLQFADGAGGSYDTSLYRTSAGVLKTDGKLHIGTATTSSTAQLVVSTGSTTGIGLAVQGVSGQTGHLATFQTSNGQNRVWINNVGDLYSQVVRINNATNNTSPGLQVTNALSTTVAAFIQGASGQTADLLRLQDSGGNIGAAFGADGSQLTLGRAATSGTVSQGKLVLSDGTTSGYQLTLQAGTLDQSQTIVIPTTVGASDQVCLQSLANCTGTGGGIAGAGTQNYLAKFDTVGGNHVGNSIVYDNGTSVAINTNSTTAFKVEQTGVNNNTLVVDTTNGKLGVGQAPLSAGKALQVAGGASINGNTDITGTLNTTSSIYANKGLNINNVSLGDNQGNISKNYTLTGAVSIGDVVILNESALASTTTIARDARILGVATYSASYAVVAISGVATVNADTAAVAVGDQLVTSTTAGHVTVDNNATTGILGYATTSKAAGSNGTVGVRLQIQTGQYSPVFRNASDSTTAFQVQNAAGTDLLRVDTLNSNVVANGVCVAGWGAVGIGTGCLNAAKLSVATSAIGAQISVNGSTQDILQLQDDGVNVVTVGSTGTTLFKNSADSTAAVRVQNAAGTNLFVVDTTNQRLAVGPAAVPANGVLTVGTNTTTTAGGVYFGTDTVLYRNGTSSLRTSGNLSVDGNLTLVSCDTVTAKFCVNTSGLGANINVSGANDILNLRTGSTLVTQVTSTGSTLFRNASNSSAGFTVQNASSASLLNVNTSDGTTSISGVRSAEVGSWTTGPNLPAVREEHTGVYSNGYLYVLGGSGSYPAASPMNSVAYSAISSTNGSMGSWASTTNLPAALFEGAAANYNGYIYYTGGQDGTNTVGTVYYAKQNANGTLGSWATANALPAARRQHTATVVNGYLYVVGGYNTSGVTQATTYYAKINSDGTLGSWSIATALPAARNYHAAAAANGYIYILAGQNTSNFATVYYAKPDATTGAISAWTTSANPLPVAYRLGWAAAINNYLYYIGGYDGAGSALIRYAPLNALTGANGSWTTNATNRPTTNWFNNIVAANGYLYETGGGFAINTTRYAALTSLTSNNVIEIQTNGGNVATVNGSGHVVIQNSLDATNSFQIQNASGQSLLVADTFNQRLAVGPGAVPATSVLTVGSNTSTPDGGITFGTDTSLYRFGANVLGTDSRLLINAASSGAFGLSVRAAGDSNDRLQILGNGTIQFGSGSGLADTTLYRSAANTLKTDDNFAIQTTTNSTTAFQIQNAAGTTALSVDTVALTTAVQAQYDVLSTGSNLISTTDFTNPAWTSTGWTTSTTTATHNTGNTSALSTNQVTPVSGTTYQISYTISGSPATGSTLTTSFGGVTLATHTFATTASSSGFTETRLMTATSGSGNLTFTPSTNFNGVISAVEVRVVTQQPTAALVVKNASGVANIEVRPSNSASNTLIGLSSGSALSTGVQNTALGSSSLQYNTTGSDNAAFGYQALQANSSGANNTALGSRALQANTVGRGNTAVGQLVLSNNVTGNFNSALGVNALAANVSGAFNTAIGTSALQSTVNSINNVALGSNALSLLTTGGNNTALGVNTLNGLSIGSSNIAIGFNSGSNVGIGNQLSSGSFNTFIGYYSGLTNSTQVSRSAAIGTHAQVGSNDSIILGCVGGINSCTATTTVGIGTQYAPNALTVSPGTYSTGTISQSGTALTGSGTTFTSAMTAGTIYYSDGTSAVITAYNSATSLTVSVSKTVSAGASYTIVYGGFNVTSSGAAYLQPTTDTANAFRIQNAAGGELFRADTTNNAVVLGYSGVVGIGASASDAKLNVGTSLVGLRVNQTGSSNLLELQNNGTNVATVSSTGATVFRNSVNSSGALVVQNSAGDALFNVDTTTTNLVNNSSFESNTTGWVAKGSASIAQDSTNYYVGNNGLAISTTNVGHGASFPVVLAPNTTYTMSLMARISSGSYLSSLLLGRQDNGSDINCSPFYADSRWNRISCTFTTGSTIASSNIYLQQTDAVARTIYIDAVQLNANNTSPVYTNGKIQLNGVVTSPLTLQNANNSFRAFQVLQANGTDFLVGNTSDRSLYVNGRINLQGTISNTATLSTTAATHDVLVATDSSGFKVGTTSIARNPKVFGVAEYGNPAGSGVEVRRFGYTTVNADATYGPINPGDQLVTSPTAGRVMADNKATSGILGLAKSALASGTGTVTVELMIVGGQDTPRFQNTADSTTAFQIQNAAGTSNLFNADTTNTRIGIGTATPGYTLDVNGDVNTTGAFRINGVQISSSSLSDTSNLAKLDANQTFTGYNTFRNTANSTTAFQIQNAAGTPLLAVDTTNSQLSVRGSNSDATLGVELIATTDFTDPDWTSTGWNTTTTTATHNTGNTSALSTNQFSVVAGTTYLVSYTVNIPYSGTLTPQIGGVSGTNASNNQGSGSLPVSQIITATTTGSFQLVPSSTFNGTVSAVSVKAIVTSTNNSVLQLQNSSGTTSLEVRASGSTTNAFVGLNAGKANASGVNNTGFGAGALQANVTGSDNAAFGYISLQSNINGSRNTAFGSQTLRSNLSGLSNAAVGTEALQANTHGTYNVAVGDSALRANTVGSGNNAIGYRALISNTTGSSNVAVGINALAANTSANNSTALGYLALGTSNAANSVGVGSAAGYNITTGVNNTLVGSKSGQSDTDGFSTVGTVQNSTALGYAAQIQASNALILGGAGANAVNVGIGTTAPANLLSVSPVLYSTGTASRTNASATVLGTGTTWASSMVGKEIIFADGFKSTIANVTDATTLLMAANATITDASPVKYRIHQAALQVTSGGSVGIGTLNPTATLDVAGDALFKNVTDSTTAFQIQNAAGTNLFVADTTNGRLAVGPSAVPANGVLTVGTNTTTAAGGIYFGTDVNLYRVNGAQLRTDNQFYAGAGLYYSGSSGYIGTFGGSGSTNAVLLQSGASSSAGNTGAVTVQSGANTGTGNSGNVVLQSGNAANGNSGNVIIDAGSASGTGGSITIGTTNASDITIGRSGTTTTVASNLLQVTGDITGGNILTVTNALKLNNSSTSAGSIQKNMPVGTGGVTASKNVVVLADDSGAKVIQSATQRDVRVYGVAEGTASTGGTVMVSVAGHTSVNVDTAAVAIGDQLVVSATSGLATVDNNATTGIIGYATSAKSAGSTGTVGIRIQITTGQYSPTFRNATDSTTAFQIQNAAGSNIFATDTTNQRVSIGNFTGTAPARLQIATGGGANRGLTIDAPSGQTGEYIMFSGNGGIYAQVTANGSFITNTGIFGTYAQSAAAVNSSTLQLRSGNASGAGAISGGVILDAGAGAAGNGSITIGTTNASALTLGRSGVTTTVNGNLTATGSTLFKNTADSTTAFQIQNAAGTNLLVVDTTNQRLAVGSSAVPANGVLTLGTDTTTASGGLYFGTDTNLYRSAIGTLRTDTNLSVGGVLYTSGSFRADGIGTCASTYASYKSCIQTTGAGQVVNVSGSNSILNLQQSGTDVLAVGSTGTTLLKNTVDSSSAFQIQNAAGTSVFNVDTTSGALTAGVVGVVSNINGTLNVSNGLSTSYVRAGSVYEVSRTTSSDVTSADVLIYDSSGTVTQTTTARDPRVMGVARSSVSTGQSVAVAISGEATVKVDTGAVNVGDQLVTSTTANRATVDNSATTGIIGIALASKAAGSNGSVNALIRPVGGQYSPTFRNAVDSTAAFRIQNAAGTNLLVADTSASSITVGTGGTFVADAANAEVSVGGTTAQGIKLSVLTGSKVGLSVNQTGALNIAQLQSNGTNVLTVASSGASTFRNASNSTTAFQVQNSSGTNLFTIDTTNNRTAIGPSAVPANAALTIGTNTTTADGGMYFGTDTSLYRAGTGLLRTGGSFASTGVMWANYLTGNQVALGYINGSTNGPGITFSSAMDTNLYRSAAGVLKTDSSFQVAGTGTSYVMGPLGLGTTNPQAASAMTIANGSWMTAVDSTGSGYVNMFKVNANNEIQVGAAMNVDGGIVLPTNGGQLTLVDMPIDATASAGTAQSYSFRVGSTNALTVYGQADGSGNAQNLRVAVGSSISPQYTLDVGGDINTSTMYRVGGVQIASTNLSDGSNLAKLNGTQTFTGANTLQNTSTTAFRIQNTGGSTTLFVADTTNSRIAVGPAAVAANAVLTVGTNTTTASGGIYFGTDTALYRSAANTLTTPGALTVVGALQADSLTLTGACCGTGINFNNENMVGLNNIQISDSGPGEGFSWADATWSIDNSPLDRSNTTGNLNLYGTTGNVAIWRPALFVQNATSYATATAGANGSLAFTSTGTGGFSFKNGSDSTTALQIQNAAGTGLFTADASNLLIKIGTGTPTLPSTGQGDLFVTGSLEVLGAVLIGTSSNGAMFDGTTHELVFTGSARHARTATLAPSYAGSAIRGDGTNNTGTMSTSFCSGSSKLNIPASGNPCGANDQRTYYEWTADATNDNDIWVTYKLPTDFSAFDTNAFTFHGWGSTSSETAVLTVYNGSTSCGTFTLTGDGSWQSNNITASTINSNCAGLAAGDVLTIDVKLTVGTNGNFARAGEILVNYLSRY